MKKAFKRGLIKAAASTEAWLGQLIYELKYLFATFMAFLI
jgi:hypothetical protein